MAPCYDHLGNVDANLIQQLTRESLSNFQNTVDLEILVSTIIIVALDNTLSRIFSQHDLCQDYN